MECEGFFLRILFLVLLGCCRVLCICLLVLLMLVPVLLVCRRSLAVFFLFRSPLRRIYPPWMCILCWLLSLGPICSRRRLVIVLGRLLGMIRTLYIFFCRFLGGCPRLLWRLLGIPFHRFRRIRRVLGWLLRGLMMVMMVLVNLMMLQLSIRILFVCRLQLLSRRLLLDILFRMLLRMLVCHLVFLCSFGRILSFRFLSMLWRLLDTLACRVCSLCMLLVLF